jgi:anaerobic C4-dicarboxylate transporter
MKLELPVTTKIDSYVLCHSFMLPGLVATVVTASTGLTRALHVMV